MCVCVADDSVCVCMYVADDSVCVCVCVCVRTQDQNKKMHKMPILLTE